jgi:hypothetical protein
MTPDAESRIIQAIAEATSRTEGRVMGALSELKGHVIRIEGRVDKLEGQCGLRHKQVDIDIAALRSKVKEYDEDAEETGHHEIASLKEELRRRDDERRKWIFYFVTAAVSFATGGTGIALLLKLLGK